MCFCALSRVLRKHHATTKDVQKLLYGKRNNAVHTTSQGKPSAALLLTRVPNEQLAPAVKHALALQELNRDDVLSVLRSNRALRRLDRSLVLYDALIDAKFPLTAHHFSLLMAHANDEGDGERAMQFWRAAVHEGKVNDKVHGALLATYRNAGKWAAAVQHCQQLWEDKHVLDPHALHTVLNACRRYGPWQAGLEVFSQAMKHDTKPNSVVYLELLRTVEHARGMPARWKYATAILDALHGKIDVTAGHYNAVLATLGGRHTWKKGVELFEAMKVQSVQPSRDTLEHLLLLNPGNVSHCIRCVAEAHALGMPVTDTMYRAVASNLFRLQLDHEASQFAEREYKRDIEDPGHTSTTTLALSFALIDSLLAHPRPQDAVVFYNTFEPRLGDAVGPATRALGTLGQPSQRWLVQGRVAVVDHNIVLSPRMESLLHHYDSIFIPFSSVRLLVRRARLMGATPQGRFARNAFRRLERLVQTPEWGQVARVLPLSHQLQAQQYLVDGPTSAEALAQLRVEANAHGSSSGTGEAESFSQRLLASITSIKDEGGLAKGGGAGAAAAAAVAECAEATATVDGEHMLIRSCRSPPSLSPSSLSVLARQQHDHQVAAARMKNAYKLRETDRINSAERVLAVAVMLKSLNSDSDIHVLSTNAAQLAVVAKWNACRPQAALTPVQYPGELFDKAPPVENSASSPASSSTAATPLVDTQQLLPDDVLLGGGSWREEFHDELGMDGGQRGTGGYGTVGSFLSPS